MKFSTQILFVALFATVLLASCKKDEQVDPWAAAKADCAKKNNPLYDYNWNETYHRCDSVYTGTVVNDTIHLTQGAIFAEWNNNLTSANTILSQGKYVELKFKCNQLYGVLNQLNDYLLIQKGLQGTHGERFIVKWNGKGVGLANSNTEVPQHSMWKQWGESQNKVPLTDTLYKIPVTVQEYNLYTADGVSSSIFKKIWDKVNVTNTAEMTNAPAAITTAHNNGSDTVIVNANGIMVMLATQYSFAVAFNAAVHQPWVKYNENNFTYAPDAAGQQISDQQNTDMGDKCLSANPTNGAKFEVFVLDANQFCGVFNTYTNTQPTQSINTATDFQSRVQYVRQNYNEGTGPIPIELNSDINNMQTQTNVDYMKALAGMGDSVSYTNPNIKRIRPGVGNEFEISVNALNFYNNKNSLGTTDWNTTGNWRILDTDNPNNVPSGQNVIQNNAPSSQLSNNVFVYNINMTGPLDMRKPVFWLNNGAYDPGRQTNITPNGSNLQYVNQPVAENLAMPSVPDNTKVFQLTADCKIAPYMSNPYATSVGIDLQYLNNHIIKLLYYSQQVAGSGQKIVKSAYSTVILNITVPINYMTTDNPAKPLFSCSNWHSILVSNIFYIPPNNLSTARIIYPDSSVFVGQFEYDFYNSNISGFKNDYGIDGNNISILPTGNGYTIALLLQQLPTSPAPSYLPAKNKVVPIKTSEINAKIHHLRQR